MEKGKHELPLQSQKGEQQLPLQSEKRKQQNEEVSFIQTKPLHNKKRQLYPEMDVGTDVQMDTPDVGTDVQADVPTDVQSGAQVDLKKRKCEIPTKFTMGKSEIQEQEKAQNWKRKFLSDNQHEETQKKRPKLLETVMPAQNQENYFTEEDDQKKIQFEPGPDDFLPKRA